MDRARNGFVSDVEDEATVVGNEENEVTQETSVVSVCRKQLKWWLS